MKTKNTTNTDTAVIAGTPPVDSPEAKEVTIAQPRRHQSPVPQKKETRRHDPADGDPPIGEISIEPMCSLREQKCSSCNHATAKYALVLWLDETTLLNLPICSIGKQSLCEPAVTRRAKEELADFLRRKRLIVGQLLAQRMPPEEVLQKDQPIMPSPRPSPQPHVNDVGRPQKIEPLQPRRQQPEIYQQKSKPPKVQDVFPPSSNGTFSRVKEVFRNPAELRSAAVHCFNKKYRQTKPAGVATRKTKALILEEMIGLCAVAHVAEAIATLHSKNLLGQSVLTEGGYLRTLGDLAEWRLGDDAKILVLSFISNAYDTIHCVGAKTKKSLVANYLLLNPLEAADRAKIKAWTMNCAQVLLSRAVGKPAKRKWQRRCQQATSKD